MRLVFKQWGIVNDRVWAVCLIWRVDARGAGVVGLICIGSKHLPCCMDYSNVRALGRVACVTAMENEPMSNLVTNPYYYRLVSGCHCYRGPTDKCCMGICRNPFQIEWWWSHDKLLNRALTWCQAIWTCRMMTGVDYRSGLSQSYGRGRLKMTLCLCCRWCWWFVAAQLDW